MAGLCLSGCGAVVTVAIAVGRSGSGRVSVSVVFDQAATAELHELETGLSLSDLRAAGWSVSGPSPLADGGTTITASHGFTALAQIPVLMADIAGSGPPPQRPFRLSVSEKTGTFHDTFSATGAVDLSCSLACFDDPHLAKNVGYPLGLSLAQLKRLLGPDPATTLSFKLQLRMPGAVAASNTQDRGPLGALVWHAPLGSDTRLSADSRTTNEGALRSVEGASVLVVLLLASALIVVGARRRRRRRQRQLRDRRRRPA